MPISQGFPVAMLMFDCPRITFELLRRLFIHSFASWLI